MSTISCTATWTRSICGCVRPTSPPRVCWSPGARSRRRCASSDDHVDQLVAHLRCPLEHRKRTRSTNLLERTFVEVRRRTKIIGRFPGETSALSLIWAVLELASRGWRGITMTPRTVAEIERIRRRATNIDAAADTRAEGVTAA